MRPRRPEEKERQVAGETGSERMAGMDFQGMTLVSERGENAPELGLPALEPKWPFGTPSTELSLGRVASPQSPPPFHSAGCMYGVQGRRTRSRRSEAGRAVSESVSVTKARRSVAKECSIFV